MLNLKSFLFSISLLATTLTATALDHPASGPTADLGSEISSILEGINFDDATWESTTLYVKFIIDDNDKLIVLSSGKDEVAAMVKNRLNYQTIKTKAKQNNTVYTIPVTIQKH